MFLEGDSIVMADDTERREAITQLILEGRITRSIEKYERMWEFKTLTVDERHQLWDFAKSSTKNNSDRFAITFQLEMLKAALVSLDSYILSDENREKLFDNLPPSMVGGLFEEYVNQIDRFQSNAINDIDFIKSLTSDDLLRIKFDVMYHVHALPTEQRVRDMNDYQWIWYWLNIQEQKKKHYKEVQDNIDYLSFFINPEIAQSVRNQREGGSSTGGAHTEKNPYNPSQVTVYGNTTVDNDFDEKLKMFLKDGETFTDLKDERTPGNANESRDDFIARAMQMEKIVNEQNKQAQDAGVNPEDLDVIDVR